MISQPSLDAGVPSGTERRFCSWATGWRSVLMREYRDAQHVDDYTTTPTPDQKIVLVSAGSCSIEAMAGGAWHGARYRPGHIGLVAPDEAARLRWHGTECHHTVQLHVPGATVAQIADALTGPGRAHASPLGCLSVVDPVVTATVLALRRAARTGAPDLYADTAAHFLISHLLLGHGRSGVRTRCASGGPALRRVEDYMQAHLAGPVSLAELAEIAGVGRFQLLRMAKRAWGETPQRHLTRMRMQLAQRLLLSKRMPVIEVALDCGYGSPAHFATAFRRFTGQSPSEFRQSG